MADSLTATLLAKLDTTFTNTLTGSGGTSSVQLTESLSLSFTDGTTSSKADKVWGSRDRSLTSGNSEDIDMYDLGSLDIGAGAGEDPLGNTVTLVEIAALIVINSSTSAGDLIVGGKSTTAAWNSIFNADDDAVVVVKPNGVFLIGTTTDAAYAVADTSNHLLKIAASGGNCTYSILFIARSA